MYILLVRVCVGAHHMQRWGQANISVDALHGYKLVILWPLLVARHACVFRTTHQLDPRDMVVVTYWC